jgi:hypothetical protein
MDFTKLAIAGSVVGGLYLATKSEPEAEAEATETQLPFEIPSTMGPAPLQALPGATPTALQQISQGPTLNTGLVSLPSGQSGGVQLEDIAKGLASIKAPVNVSAKSLIQRLGAGDTSIFSKPYTAKQANTTSFQIVKGERVKDPSSIGAKSDAELQRMTISLTDWGEYRFFSTLLAIGYVMAEQPDRNKQIYGVRLLDWFFYHRWHIADSLKEKMAQAAYETSCRRKYKRAPKHYHNNYPFHWIPNEANPGGPPLRRTRGQRRDAFAQNITWHERYKGFPALARWGKAYDGHKPHPMQDGGSFAEANKVPLDCWGQEAQSADRIKAQFIHDLGNEFWGERVDGGVTAGPCEAMLEYAGARFAQLMLCQSVDPNLGKASGLHLMKALESAGGIAMSAIAAGIAAAMGASMTIPVAGWIAAAVMAVGAAIMGIIGVLNEQGKMRDLRQQISDKYNTLLLKSFNTFGRAGGVFSSGVAGFSGHRLGLVVPEKNEESGIEWFWDEVRDPLFSHFALVRSTLPADSIPQLPAHYLGLEFALPIGAQLPALDGNSYLMVLQPICRSVASCGTSDPLGPYELEDQCVPCVVDGELQTDCPGGNDTVAGFRSCGCTYEQYGKYLAKNATETHAGLKEAIQTSKDAYMPESTPQTPSMAPVEQDSSSSNVGGILLAVGAIGGILILSSRHEKPVSR